MALSHSQHTDPRTEEMSRHRRALRVLVVVLIPLAIWTLAGVIALWPGNVAKHIAKDVAGYSVPGSTYPIARITNITEVSCEGQAGSTPGVNNQTCATIAAQLLEGDDKGKTVQVSLTSALYGSGTKIGQKVQLFRLPAADGQPAQYQFSDFERGAPLLALGLLFVGVVIVVARWRGLASLLGLALAALIVVKFIFPGLISGTNPLLVGMIGSSAILFVVLLAAHGFGVRCLTALVGSLCGLILTGVIGFLATRWTHLTGIASEDDYVLAASAPDMALTSVVICAIIVAGLGLLTSVTLRQASTVWELAESDRSQRRLFTRAMRIGRDHLPSTVYTMAFAMAGAALPVLLSIVIDDRPVLDVMQTEQFANELVLTLVASIGIVLAVPVTTAVGVAIVRVTRRRSRPAATGKARPGPDDDDTVILQPTQRRRRRRNDFDDFGDFSDLRDPSTDAPDLRSRRSP